MKMRKIYRILLWVQGSYFLLTSLWALIDIKSFMEVSGYKTDQWLVKTVAVLITSIALCMFAALFTKKESLPVNVLGISSSAGLATIDFYYVANGTIKWVYAADGVLEVLFLCTWIFIATSKSKDSA